MSPLCLLCMLFACLLAAKAAPEQDIISWVRRNGGMVRPLCIRETKVDSCGNILGTLCCSLVILCVRPRDRSTLSSAS